MAKREISNSDDVIDSRDVIARIEELEADLAPPDLECICKEPGEDGELKTTGDGSTALKPRMATCGTCGFMWCERCEPCPAARTPCEGTGKHDEGAWEELVTLRALAEEASGYAPDWRYGEVLIRDSYFEDYARELAEDIGAIPDDATWPNTCIDWKEAARQLQQDYTSVEFDGVTYWIR